ncbi:Dps family protein [Emcibacter sp.]|uniref:Dps family protein n=1 Tax=Emcibacter sp. TaxID=1979954 RepID=UPI003A90E3A7
MTNTTLKMVDDKDVNIGVQKKNRLKVAEALSGCLASTYSLYMKTLFYHWNVTGPQFRDLHKMFEEQYQELHSAGDEIAERIRALGHFAPGTYSEYSKLSDVEEDKELPSSSGEMLSNLLKAHETCSARARKVLKVAEDAEDEVTADMMVERMSIHDEAAWMLRATLE